MGFSEKIKLEVKKKAAFRCCRCSDIGVEIHHILPQKDGGPDEIDNAAPLCPSCHEKFGDNPKKRKEIRSMRDWWYEVVEEKYGNKDTIQRLEQISGSLETVKQGHSEELAELKDMLLKFSADTINNMTKETASVATSSVVSATTLSNNVHANFHCKNCNTSIGLLVGSNDCPSCGHPI